MSNESENIIEQKLIEVIGQDTINMIVNEIVVAIGAAPYGSSLSIDFSLGVRIPYGGRDRLRGIINSRLNVEAHGASITIREKRVEEKTVTGSIFYFSSGTFHLSLF